MLRLTAVFIGACLFGTSSFAATVPATPIERATPPYPLEAGGVEGAVIIGFTIGADGHVKDATVTESMPPGTFDAVALAAVSTWRYNPRTEDDRPVEQPGNTIRLHFKQDDESPYQLVYAPRADYPLDAWRAKQQGWVKVEVSLSPFWTVYDTRVVDSQPPKVFDEAAVNALRTWRFAPVIANGKMTMPGKVTITVPFTMTNAKVALRQTKRTVPRYPNFAETGGQGGFCIVHYQIGPDGHVASPQVVATYPGHVFTDASLAALNAWTFEPPSADPSVPWHTDGEVTFKYMIDGEPYYGLDAGQWVKLRYTLGTDGHAKDIEVVEKSSASVGERLAIDQLKDTLLKPATENGVPVEKKGLLMTMRGAPSH